MKISIAINTFFLFCISSISIAGKSCPVCKGKLVDTQSQKDDRSKSSRNLAVWNRSSCANPFYHKGSLICLNGGYAYEPTLKTWNLSLTDREKFKLPLPKSIHSFPLPEKTNIKSEVVYSQEFSSIKKVKHAIHFWCVTDPVYFKKVQAYATSNKLTLTIEKERTKGQSIIQVTKKN